MGYSALIAGGSGLVGGSVIDFLIADNDCEKIISIGRKELPKSHKKLHQEIVDFKRLEDYQNLFLVDKVFCCLGTTIKKAGSKEKFKMVDYEFPVKMAEISSKTNVNVYSIITALGSDKNSAFFYNKVKGEVEAKLETKQIPSINVIQPSLLMGEREENRFGESVAIATFKLINPLFAGPLKKYKGIQGEQVAKAMFEIAKVGKIGFHKFRNDELFEY